MTSQRLLSIRNADLAKLQSQLAAAQSAAKAATTTAPPPAPAPEAAAPAPAASAPPEPATRRQRAGTGFRANRGSRFRACRRRQWRGRLGARVKHRPHMVPVAVEESNGSILGLVRSIGGRWLALVAVIAAFFGLRALARAPPVQL